jgi:hypothetical protein
MQGSAAERHRIAQALQFGHVSASWLHIVTALN